jgi:hypothetical protein
MSIIDELYQENSSTFNKNSCLYVRLLTAFSILWLFITIAARMLFLLPFPISLPVYPLENDYCPPDMRSFGFSPSFFAYSIWVKKQRGRENILLFSPPLSVPG